MTDTLRRTAPLNAARRSRKVNGASWFVGLVGAIGLEPMTPTV